MARNKSEMDFDRMRKDRVRSETGSDLLKLKEGQTLFYICPPVHEEEPVPYAEGQMHFSIGPDKGVVVNLEGLEECEPIVEALNKKGISWDAAVEGWERCAELVARHGDEKRQGARNRWWFNVVVLGHRVSSRKPWDEPDPKVSILACGKKIYDGITDIFFDEGDITDPEKAIFVIVKRTGTGLDTEYTVKADTDSLKKPVELDDDLWDVIEAACLPGKANDLHAHLVSMVKTADQVEALWYGEKGGDDEDDEDDARGRRKAKVTSRPASQRRRKKADPEPEDEVEEDEVDEPEEDEVDEPEEDAAPAPKKRRSRKVEEPEDDDGEELSDADELDAELAKRAAKSRRRRKK